MLAMLFGHLAAISCAAALALAGVLGFAAVVARLAAALAFAGVLALTGVLFFHLLVSLGALIILRRSLGEVLGRDRSAGSREKTRDSRACE